VLVIALGVTARLWAATRGHSFDFDLWVAVADIYHKGGNVYVESHQYVYGPVWFWIVGVLGQIAHLFPDSALAFHYILPSFLTLVDIGVLFILKRRFGPIAAILFFLNPISIAISGYHVQVDNIAMLLGLWVTELWEGCTDTPLGMRKLAGLAILGLSIATKQILFAFPLWLAVKQKGYVQKGITLTLPIALFLLSFIPFWQTGSQGIIKNVFLYPSWDNGITWNYLPGYLRLLINRDTLFFISLALFAIVFRVESPSNSLLLYSCVLLIFTPYVANQHFAIPLGVTSAYPNIFFLLYTATASFYIFAEHIGLGWLLSIVSSRVDGNFTHITLLSLGFVYYLSAPWIRAKVREGRAGWRSIGAVTAIITVVLLSFRLIDAEVARGRFVTEIPSTLVSAQADYDSEIRLLGYDNYSSNFQPEGNLAVALYWQAITSPHADYTASIQLLDLDNQRVASIDVPLGFDYILPYPSSRWRSGEIIQQTYTLRLPAADIPTPLRVVAIVYKTPGRPLPITDTHIQTIGDAAVITGVSALPQPSQTLSPPRRSLSLLADAQIEIVGTSLDVTHTLASKHSLTFEIDWRARVHPRRLYHLFLHLLDSKGNLIAQLDGPPIPSFPTDTWPSNSTWRGTYTLNVSDTVPPGNYSLVAGLYEIGNGERLTLTGEPALLLPDNRFLLATIRVP